MPDYLLNRRQMLQGVLAACSCASLPLVAADDKLPKSQFSFGFSLYGMKSLPWRESLERCAGIGYDGVELACMPGWPGAPEALSAADRLEFRQRLDDLGLRLNSVMENLPIQSDSEKHKLQLERIKQLADLAHELDPVSDQPVFETVLGSQPPLWPEVKDLFVDRLGDWGQTAQEAQLRIAAKPHVGGALHRSADAVWLVEQVKQPAVRLAFDYSHFVLRGEKLAEAWAAMAPYTIFIHVKDAAGTAEKVQFQLPGEQGIDYREYSRLLRESKYQGPLVVEVSGQLSSKPDYDPVVAAQVSFKRLAPIFEEAGLWRS